MALLGETVAAFREIFSAPFRAALLKIFGLTLGLLVLLATAAHAGLVALASPQTPWLATVLSVAEGLGLAFASIFLVAPVSALVAGFFVDDLAAAVEADLDPGGPPGRALPAGRAVLLSLRFAVLSLLVILVAFALLLVPGVNAIAFLAANAFLSGRQYFEFAAMRFRSLEEARLLREAHPGAVYGAGLVIAALLAVPLLNLVTPLFATALMVRVHRRLARRTALLGRR